MTPASRWSAADVARAAGLEHAPTPEQAQVIEAPLGPLLVVAGAGSGKTETMAARVVWLVANGYVTPDQVLGLTFTRKAAGELAERVALRLRRLEAAGLWAPEPDESGAQVLSSTPTISTYHAYAGRLVTEHAVRLGIEPDSRLLSEAAAWQFAAEAVARHDGELGLLTKAESSIVAAVVDLAGELAEHLTEPDAVRAELDAVLAAVAATPLARGKRVAPLAKVTDALRERRAVLAVVEDFQRLKRGRDAMDFADQVALAARLARTFPDIGAAERGRYRAVLLDEFQDTSEAQLALLRDLFVAPSGTRGGHSAASDPSVTAVGDPHQAIYGWRGASSATLTRFPVEFAAADGPAPVLGLATTWRNDTAVLAAANLLAAPLRAVSRIPVAPLAARPGAGPGDLEVARLGTQAQEAAYLVDWLVRVRARATVSAAVLCRKRSQFGPVIEALEAAGVPYEVVGLGGLLLTPEIVDLVALLQVVADPTRGDALMRLLTGPMCRLGAADLDALHEWARERQRLNRRVDLGELPLDLDPAVRDADGEGSAAGRGRLVELAPDSVDEPSIVEAVEELPPPNWRGRAGEHLDPEVSGRLHGLAIAIRRVRSLTGLPLADLVGEAERSLGLDVEVLSRPEHPPAVARVHLDAFADVAATFSVSADRPTLEAFLAWLAAAEAEERGLEAATLEPTPGAVQVLTVHAAKGLEWDVVAVPGLAEGTFPTWQPAPVVKPAGSGWQVDDPRPSGWTGGLSGLPYSLRGDRESLPCFRYAAARDSAELTARHDEFRDAEGRRILDEERRLVYVAVTRARRRLLLTAPVWLASGQRPRVTSRFLEEIRAAAGALGVRQGPWEPLPEPTDELVNPLLEQVRTVLWPVDPEPARRAAVERAAAAVQAARAARGGQLQLAVGPAGAGPATSEEQALDADLAVLLAERRAEQDRGEEVLDLPGHLSASDLVRLAADPRGFAVAWRRPVPSAPALAARRGTAFHAWVERHYSRAALVDLLELPGAADDDASSVPGLPGTEADLALLTGHFLASEWAAREPVEIEIAVETVLDGVAVRGRIDAVFARPDGGVSIVDWKTGDPPADQAQEQVRAVQLGAYALAYARLRGLDPGWVDGAFFYARTGQTVWPRLPTAPELSAILAIVGERPG